MKFMGFSFTRLNVERGSENYKDLKINTNIDIVDVASAKSNFMKTKEEVVIIKFKYIVEYSNKVGNLDIEGNVAIAFDQKDAKELLKQWKNKKIPENLRAPIFNMILRKTTLKALELEDEMNLPLHTRTIPSIKKNQD